MNRLHLIVMACIALLALLLWQSLPTPPISPDRPPNPSPDASPAQSSTTTQGYLIRGAQVFDGDRVWPRADVEVRDGRIHAIAEQLPAAADLTEVNGQGHTLLPGLIDAHVHTWGEARRQMLRFGVTTAIDQFSAPGELPTYQRERASLAATDRADIWSAGALVTAAGGHGTQFGMPLDTLDQASQAEEIVRNRLTQGSDFIKFVLDDGHHYGEHSHYATLDAERVQALLAASTQHGLMAVAHVATHDDAQLAITAGAKGLVHVYGDAPRDDALPTLIRDHAAFVVPTLSVMAAIAGDHEGSTLSEDPDLAAHLDATQRQQLGSRFAAGVQGEALFTHALANTAQLHAQGVTLLAGTDAGNPGTAHGVSLHGELALLVRAGLSPEQALRAATAAPADAFGLSDRGRITPGLRADLLLVEGDPLTDIRATRKIAQIWKNGHFVDRQLAAAPSDDLPTLTPWQAAFDSAEAWQATTDQYIGGTSSVELELIPLSAKDPAHLRLRGRINLGAGYAWSGTLQTFGDPPMSAVNGNALKTLQVRLRGEPRDVVVMLFSGDASNSVPAMQTLTLQPGGQWQTYRLPLTQFLGLDSSRLRAVAVTASLPEGDFSFDLAELTVQ